MRFAATLLPHPIARARLSAALPPGMSMRACESATELRQLAFAAGAAMVVAEPVDRTGHPTWPILSQIKHSFCGMPVLGYCTSSRAFTQHIAEFGRAGIHDFILFDVDDDRGLLQERVARARTIGSAEWALAELRPCVHVRIAPILQVCLVHANRKLGVAEVATLLGVHRKTLVNWCTAAQSPPPEHLVSWCRLLIVGRMLEDVGRPVEQIALELDFTSANAMRGMLSRYVNMSPTELRQHGAAQCVLAGFKRALRAPGMPAPDPGDRDPDRRALVDRVTSPDSAGRIAGARRDLQ